MISRLKNRNEQARWFSGAWLASSVGPERGTEMPTEDGFYVVTVIDNPHGYRSGVVEVVTHQNNGKPWPWAYRVPERMHRKTHGNPLKFWTGCEWRGPLTMLHAKTPRSATRLENL